MNARIQIPEARLAAFCRCHHTRRLSLFGSVLRDDFTPESDIDILVEFEPNHPVGLMGLAGMEIELSKILGHQAEIHTVAGLHPGFRDEVLEVAELKYEQA